MRDAAPAAKVAEFGEGGIGMGMAREETSEQRVREGGSLCGRLSRSLKGNEGRERERTTKESFDYVNISKSCAAHANVRSFLLRA